MGLNKQLLLGSAAILVAATGAQAADLPSRKAAPVEYVKICDAYGAGFFYIPGTNTCLLIGGEVRLIEQYTPAQKVYTESNAPPIAGSQVSQVAKDQDQTGFEFRGILKEDSRTQSDYGTVRTYVRVRGTNTDGVRQTGGASNFQTLYAPAGNGSSSFKMERSYIQFAGITAGLMDENFNTAPGPTYFFTSNFTSGFSNGVKAIRYDLTFAGGWTWENSIESRGDFDFAGTDTSTKGNPLAPSAVVSAPLDTYVNTPTTGYNWVSTITYTQAWGHAALSGAIGNNSVGHGTADGGLALVDAGSNNPQGGPVTYGSWAIGPEIDILVPQVAPGDEYYANFAYSVGLLGEVSGTGMNALTGDSPNRKVLGGLIREDSNLTPTMVDSAGNVLAFGQDAGWEFNTSYTHYWAPSWRSNFGFSYLEINPPTANATGAAAGLNTQWGRGTLLALQANLIWTPVKNFDIGIEVEWGEMHNTLQNANSTYIANACPAGTSTSAQSVSGCAGLNESNAIARMQISRRF